MAVLALGLIDPQAICFAGAAEPGKTCCSAESSACQCPSDLQCGQSCPLVKQQAPLDKQVPTRTTSVASAHGLVALFFLAVSKVSYPAFAPAIQKRELDTSPPFGGSPPQAILRVWLI